MRSLLGSITECVYLVFEMILVAIVALGSVVFVEMVGRLLNHYKGNIQWFG